MVSAHVKLTVTLLLFQPAALGAGLSDAAMVGGVLSTPMIWTVMPPPGLPLSSTESWLLAANVIGFSISVTFWLN